MKKVAYKKDLDERREALDHLLQQRVNLDKRIAKLRMDIGSLAQLSSQSSPVYELLHQIKKQVTQNSMPGLKSSCREVLRASNKPLTPQEVLTGIERLGRTGDHADNLSSVYTTLRRMVASGEAVESSKDGKKAFALKE